MVVDCYQDVCLVRQTEYGWVGACWSDMGLAGFAFGRHSPQDVVSDLSSSAARSLRSPVDRDQRQLDRLIEVLEGRRVDSLLNVKLDLSDHTEFRQRVVQACREIPRGETISYGELAKRAGSPGAARAAGGVMARNRFPLIVPCHRVVAANSIGGFSAPDGVSLKRRLLAAEGVMLDDAADSQAALRS